MTTDRWVRHSWDLTNLAEPAPLPEGFVLRTGGRGELADILGVLASAFGSDPDWEEELGELLGRLNRRLRSTIGASDCQYLLATTDASQSVAVSGLAKNHWTGQNLLTGVCTHPRYQRRGLGTSMLSHSLHHLRAMGLPKARVYTREGSVADRYLYPHFDSVRIAGVVCPAADEALGQSRLMRGWVRFS